MGELVPQKPEEAETEHSVPKETTDMAIVSKGEPVSWRVLTPARLLVVFSLINFINFVHRGAISSNGVNGTPKTCTPSGQCTPGSGIQGAFNLSNFQDGVLSSSYLVGVMVASPIFAGLVKRFNQLRLIGFGLTVWTLATVGCGFSMGFWSITIFRTLVGVGIAPFVSIGGPYVMEVAPEAQKGTWLSIFYTCIPAGVSIGYVYGGLVGDHFSWRYAFFGVAILMFPFAVLGFLMKPLEVKDDSSGKDGGKLPVEEEFIHQGSKGPSNLSWKDMKVLLLNNLHVLSRFWEDMTVLLLNNLHDMKVLLLNNLHDVKVLSLNNVYVVNVLGNIAYNFVLGAYSYWGPKAGYSIYHMKNADMVFGGVTMVCGIVGTIAGGLVLDKLMNSARKDSPSQRTKSKNSVRVDSPSQRTKSISNAFQILSIATFAGAALCFSSFCSHNVYVFISLFTVGELLLFTTTSPVNFICLQCVQPSMRPISMAMSGVAMHLFGDVPSPPLVGVLQDYLKNWRYTTLSLTAVLFLAAIMWFIGIFLHMAEKPNGDCENQVTVVSNSNEAPMVDEMTVERTKFSAEP